VLSLAAMAIDNVARVCAKPGDLVPPQRLCSCAGMAASMSIPKAKAVRFRIEPGDVPPEKAARRLHLTLAEFTDKLTELLRRGFPGPDPTTGMFCLEAIDQWRLRRFPHLFPLTSQQERSDDSDAVRQRLEAAPWER
jgi:hypothetical protein